jgi:FAD/FMN-containing dehydrogenase
MVAADVHGKNHHVAGCFGEHVTRLLLRVADGRVLECSRQLNSDLFRATLGGMGLTGHILEVELQLERIPSPWIVSEQFRLSNIEELISGLERSAREWPFTVAWVDCLTHGQRLGRGVLIRGRWAEPGEAQTGAPEPYRRPSVPFTMPDGLMRGPLVRLFNSLFYAAHGRSPRRRIVHPQSFFYPLDAVAHWNRLYGRRGVTQYQCVLPRASGRAAARRVLETLSEHGGASFLCVVKDCGAEGAGLLSFPMPGISVALDLPIRDNTPTLVSALNEAVIRAGGRIYLAKDAFSRPEHFAKMEPRLDTWRSVRDAWDPTHSIRSAQSERLLGDHS